MPEERATPLLRLANVSVRFGSIIALTDISFEVRRGEILGAQCDHPQDSPVDEDGDHCFSCRFEFRGLRADAAAALFGMAWAAHGDDPTLHRRLDGAAGNRACVCRGRDVDAQGSGPFQDGSA